LLLNDTLTCDAFRGKEEPTKILREFFSPQTALEIAGNSKRSLFFFSWDVKLFQSSAQKGILIRKWICLNSNDIKLWKEDPEQFINDELEENIQNNARVRRK
jgi:hypothetical protein